LRLAAGDTVAVVAPAGVVDRSGLEQGVRVLQTFGYRVQVAPQVYRRSHYFAGVDAARAESLKAALADPDVRAVFLARGGYGSARLLPYLDGALGTLEPKIVVGYSDTTALLAWLTGRYHWVTFHGPMVATDLPNLPATDARALREVLEGRSLPVFRLGRPVVSGRAEGRLLGGNLSTLVSLLGTPYALEIPPGAILFVEDRNERPYRIDRMLTQLRLAGVLERIGGLVLGEMPECGDGRELRRILRDLAQDRSFPVVGGLRSGHGRGKRTLPLGACVRLDTDRRVLEVAEDVVR
jgi:muramoyltetrapeptide carboxypeptidase